jgi:hypothetical protein
VASGAGWYHAAPADMTVNLPGLARHILIATAAMAALAGPPRVAREPAPPRSARRVVFAVLARTLSVLVALALGELGCRVLDLPVQMRTPPPERISSRYDPELGWSYPPGTTVISRFGSDRREIPSHFDDLGLRVRRPQATHDPTAPTVLFVGDSFTMGHGVLFEESFVGQLEALAGFPYRVVNLGVQAFGSDQSLLMLKRHLHRFNAKLVVYTFIDDHIRRNATHDRRLLQVAADVPGTKPLFGLAPDASLVLRRRPHLLPDATPRLISLLQIAWLRAGLRLWPGPSVALTQALVGEMRRVSAERRAAFLVVYWRGQEPRPTPRATVFDGMGVDVLDLGAQPPPEWRTWTIPGDPHPDGRAHAYVAELLAGRLGGERASASAGR